MSTKEEVCSAVDVQSEIEYRLILFNDDVNTFDHVIDSLIEVCNHKAEQAEQCAIIAHYKGKCTVMNGPFNEMNIAKSGLDAKGLSTEIH